ncbi:homoserine dehydrogenase [Sporosarcina sp. Marseille-Q4063]|uniref:homoserine dehydrogenase n=1 Tax=Sporosarcina sp. Marseille-Q4063 TaxID=2810514 RepID=UPI001BB069C3|nr:homoserine dehydrogenase [Sporosarcina sp. Marseille-Q4063]QUW20874.1 homoserine dehydrogenase [Sporosarcina sp. Marseille-Q4063]
MSTIKVAILGFGTVGEGVYRILNEKKNEIKLQTGYAIEISSIVVRDVEKKRIETPGIKITDSIQDVFADPDIDLIFEAIIGEEPAFKYLSKAISKGINVITANKTMFAKHGPALIAQAEKHDVKIGFEATTAGGVPIIRTLENLLKADRVQRIQGILNGTSNFILTKMRQDNVPFEVALEEAQAKGFAEADPSDDIGGKDAFRKLMILSDLAFGRQPKWDDIAISGIDKIHANDVLIATEKGLRYRHIADISIDENGILSGSVGPVLIGPEHPLYGVDGVDNAIIVDTEYLGALTLIGPGAGMYPTASAMISDFLHIVGKREKVLIPS